MNETKIDTELQLALELSETTREQSLDLNVGFDAVDNTWELIVKYFGNLEPIQNELDATVTPMLNEYAIIRISESFIGRLSEYPQIEYIEKPKALALSEMEGISASCVNPVRLPPLSLYGTGMLVAVIDSGIDYTHPDFRNDNGTSRILALWDQSVSGVPPEPYQLGSVYTAADINAALEAGTLSQRLAIVPEVDLSGHGTHVASIAAGNGRASAGRYVGVAPEADLLVVKLAPGSAQGFPRTSELMQGIDWCVRYGIEHQRPVAINVSFGNNYGDHAGTSLLEQYIDGSVNYGRTVICVGAGNEGNTGRHLSGVVDSNQRTVVEFTAASYETGLNLQIWKEYADEISVLVRSPSGSIFGEGNDALSIMNTGTDVRIFYAEPTPYNARQEIYIALIPIRDYIEEGIWQLWLNPIRIRSGGFNIWLPVAGATSTQTGFFRPTTELSLTIPSTASRAITVGAYDSRTDSYAAFSGRGYAEENLQSGIGAIYTQKPDLVAPGVNITAASPGGGYDTRSGTSMAAPFVTGAAALLMQWGVIQGNDPFLYGEKLKAALVRGTRTLTGFLEYPNSQVGWGALCVRDSL